VPLACEASALPYELHPLLCNGILYIVINYTIDDAYVCIYLFSRNKKYRVSSARDDVDVGEAFVQPSSCAFVLAAQTASPFSFISVFLF
jgi:hypothetical protein